MVHTARNKIDYDELLSAAGRGLLQNAIRKLTLLLGRRDVISLAAGAPSSDTFPIEELAEIAARVIRERGRFALQYGATRGHSGLLEQIVATMLERGVEKTGPDQIVVTTGSQQGLDLIARILIDPGDIALVELPSYIGGIIALHNAGADLVGVSQDEEGVVVDDLLEKLAVARRSGRRVKCIYTIPNFQNPSGVTLSEPRRRRLVEVADENDLIIIEDDPYFDLYFSEGPAQPKPLAALIPSRVVYLSSYSKVLAPGLRMAWLQAPEEIASRVEIAKEGADLSSSVLDQAIVVEALRSGLVRRRLPELRKFYQVRYRAMLEALRLNAPDGASWTSPAGGFFVLVTLSQGIDAAELLPRAIDNGVAYVPGQPFYVNGGGTNTLRLAFSKETPESITDGVERMCRVFKPT